MGPSWQQPRGWSVTRVMVHCDGPSFDESLQVLECIPESGRAELHECRPLGLVSRSEGDTMRILLGVVILLSVECFGQTPLKVKPDSRHQADIAKELATKPSPVILTPAVSVKLDSSPDSSGFCQQVATNLRDRLAQSRRYIVMDDAALQISLVCMTTSVSGGAASVAFTLGDDCGKQALLVHNVVTAGDPAEMSRMIYADFDEIAH
jgi:hypothetical protein